jgi:hypothetical protein
MLQIMFETNMHWARVNRFWNIKFLSNISPKRLTRCAETKFSMISGYVPNMLWDIAGKKLLFCMLLKRLKTCAQET